MSKELEEGTELQLDFQKLASVAETCPGVIPAVAQDAESGRVLMVGYVNAEALEAALRMQQAVFWSTSRNELWIKGGSSGDTLELVEARVNCEQNSILYLVRMKGKGVCHTHGKDGVARDSCYYRRIESTGTLAHEPYGASWQ